MIVKLSELSSAVAMVKSFASDMKQGVPGILLNGADGTLSVGYTDGRKAVFKKMDAEFADGEQFGQLIVPYKTFVDIIHICQPVGYVWTKDIELVVEEGNTLRVSAEKCVNVDTGEEEEQVKVVSRLKQSIRFNRPDEDKRQSILSRMDYDSMFEHEIFDAWDKEELLKLLGRLSKEEDKTILISKNQKSASVANLTYSAYIPCEEVEQCGVCVTAKLAKAIMEILGKTSCSDLEIATMDNKYCTVTTSDNMTGIWFEMAKPSRMAIQTVQNFLDIKYDSCRLVVLREAIADIVGCCIAVNNGSESMRMTFEENAEGFTEIRFGGVSTASKTNDFSVATEECTCNLDNLAELSLEINLTTIGDMLGLCKYAYVVIDIVTNDTGKYIRISDAAGKNEDGTIQVSAMYFTTAR